MMQPMDSELPNPLLPAIQSDLVRQLHAYRLKVGLTQDDIAWKLGFSAITVSRWERGVAVPDLRATGAIVDFLRRADAQMEKLLMRAVSNAKEIRNLWEGRDIRYLAGSAAEFRENPEMRALIGTGIRRYLTGHYRDCLDDAVLAAGLMRGEIAGIDVYGGPAMSITSGIPEGFVQLKRISFQSEMRGVIRGDTLSLFIPQAEAPIASGVVVHDWDTLSRPV